ncbi:hypothetical protein BH23ACT10_BH23ACT10_21870 [soil metagenome]
MPRPRHMHKEIERVVAAAEQAGWTVQHSSRGHVWGVMLCGHHTREGCRVVIYSTPRNREGDARRLARAVSKCDHTW